MYDEIDDIDAKPQAPARSQRRIWIGFAVLIGVFLLVTATIFANKSPAPTDPDKEMAAAEHAAYASALAETSRALRRARLIDFLGVYPNGKRRPAAQAKLQVIEQEEAADWAALSFIIFDTEQSLEAKLDALAKYEAVWDISLLGGREAEVMKIRASLAQQEVPAPDRDLPIDPESVPSGVSGDDLVGGSTARRSGYIQPPAPIFQPAEAERTDVVQPPIIRRNRRPKYPRRALDSGAEAVVVLELFINARGRVEITELVSVDADAYEEDFIRAAERAASRTRFSPQTVNGVPVPVQGIEKTYRFEIGD